MSDKPRGDSKLKSLPEERQAAIFEHLRENTYRKTLQWLREDGVETSIRALSEFFAWYPLRRQFLEDETTTEALVDQLKKEVGGLSEEQLDALGQRTFSLLAIRRQDTNAFVKVRSARFKAELETAKLQLREKAEARLSRSLELQRQKFRRETTELYLKWFEDRKAREIASSSVTNSDKIERLGQLMFGADWTTGVAATAPGGARSGKSKPGEVSK